jgi:UTP--glucose-1-phosphate uridylyltransferase
MKVKKAVIIAAGLGTRFLPATKAQAKELMPIVDKPVLQYIVEEMIDSGIEEIIFVINRHKIAIENHFDRMFELEFKLEESGKLDLLEKIKSTHDKIKIAYVRQWAPLGTAHALLAAREFIGDEPFAFSDADSVIDAKTPAIKQVIDVFNKYGKSVVGVKKAETDDEIANLSRYGNIYGDKVEENLFKITKSIEKPDPKKGEEVSPQGLFIAGMRFVFTPEIFPMLEKVKPGKGGEYYLNDSFNYLIEKEGMYAYNYEGEYYDTGNKVDYLRANIEFALKHEEIKDEFREYIKNLKV